MAGNSSSPLDRLVGICISVLISAAAIYIAVKLIEAVWTALVMIVAVGGVIALLIAAMRSRRNGW